MYSYSCHLYTVCFSSLHQSRWLSNCFLNVLYIGARIQNPLWTVHLSNTYINQCVITILISKLSACNRYYIRIYVHICTIHSPALNFCMQPCTCIHTGYSMTFTTHKNFGGEMKISKFRAMGIILSCILTSRKSRGGGLPPSMQPCFCTDEIRSCVKLLSCSVLNTKI